VDTSEEEARQPIYSNLPRILGNFGHARQSHRDMPLPRHPYEYDHRGSHTRHTRACTCALRGPRSLAPITCRDALQLQELPAQANLQGGYSALKLTPHASERRQKLLARPFKSSYAGRRLHARQQAATNPCSARAWGSEQRARQPVRRGRHVQGMTSKACAFKIHAS
jgi:hypothetical protein